MKYIVTHPGSAHRDDLLACAVLLAKNYGVDVKRHEVTTRDITIKILDDPEVAVVDVGGLHEPHRLNFDHHQFPQDHEPSCALTLVLKHLGVLDDAYDVLPWLRTTEELDSKGPFWWAKNHGVEWETVSSLATSPVEGWLLKNFSKEYILTEGMLLYRVLAKVGLDILNQIQTFSRRQIGLDLDCKVLKCKGLQIADASFIDRKDNPVFGLEAWCKRNCKEAAVTITQDDKGDGLCLFRRADHPRVDFYRCKDMDGVVFAHENGFVLKTSTDADLQILLQAAIID